MILGIDTSGEHCAVALVDGAVCAKRSEHLERGHAERLFPLIEAALCEIRKGFEELSLIGVCTGPGSFTGLRVGIAAARGLALSCDVPAIGVSAFDALARKALVENSHGFTVRIPAPRGVVHQQRFGPNGSPLASPEIVAADVPVSTGEHLITGAIDPAIVALLASEARDPVPPVPNYRRGADAALPREAPPVMLD